MLSNYMKVNYRMEIMEDREEGGIKIPEPDDLKDDPEQ